jgi:hypothetical protein
MSAEVHCGVGFWDALVRCGCAYKTKVCGSITMKGTLSEMSGEADGVFNNVLL